MGRRVVIVASGETERRALPHLLRHLCGEGIDVVDVRIPGRNRALTVEMAHKLVNNAWWPSVEAARPDKFVILVDTDRDEPEAVLRPFRNELAGRLDSQITASLQFACAQRHLEAWYFADAINLRAYLGGRDLGHIDTSKPDEIENPKLHLKHLLRDRLYSSVVSEEIAGRLDAPTIAGRSPSFHSFLEAVRNGGGNQQ